MASAAGISFCESNQTHFSSDKDSCPDLSNRSRLTIRIDDQYFRIPEAGMLWVGRANHCDICVAEDFRVSRVHCLIVSQNGRLTVCDVGSANGTWVNGVKIGIEPVEVHPGNVITIGGSHLHIRVSDEGLPSKPR